MIDFNPTEGLRLLQKIFTAPIFTLGDSPVSVMSFFAATMIIVGGTMLSRLIQKLLRSQFGSRLSFERGLGYALTRMLHYTMIAVSVLVAIQSVGVNLTSLTVLGGFFGVAYGSDTERVRETALSVTAHEEILSEPRPSVRFLGFGDSSLNFELLVWIRDPRKQFHTKSLIYFELEKALRRAKIEIPFPQRDVHVRSGGSAV